MINLILFYYSSEFSQAKVKEALLPEGYVLFGEPWSISYQQKRDIGNQFFLLFQQLHKLGDQGLIPESPVVGFYRPNQLVQDYLKDRGFSIKKISLPNQNGESIFCFVGG